MLIHSHNIFEKNNSLTYDKGNVSILSFVFSLPSSATSSSLHVATSCSCLPALGGRWWLCFRQQTSGKDDCSSTRPLMESRSLRLPYSNFKVWLASHLLIKFLSSESRPVVAAASVQKKPHTLRTQKCIVMWVKWNSLAAQLQHNAVGFCCSAWFDVNATLELIFVGVCISTS